MVWRLQPAEALAAIRACTGAGRTSGSGADRRAFGSEGGKRWLELDSGNTGPAILAPPTAAALGADADTLMDAPGAVVLDLPGAGRVTTQAVVKDVVIDGNLGLAFLEGKTLALDLAAERVWASG